MTPLPSRTREASETIGMLCLGGDWASAHGDFGGLRHIAEQLADHVPEPLHCEFVELATACAAEPDLAAILWNRLKNRLHRTLRWHGPSLARVVRMEPFPHRYIVSLFDGTLSALPRDPIAVGAPPQFGGSDRVWSPEELLVGSTLECLWTTFEAYARRDGMLVRHWAGSGVGILERTATVPVFTSIELTVHVEVDVGHEERARVLLMKAEANCIIANALRVPVVVKASVDPYAAAS